MSLMASIGRLLFGENQPGTHLPYIGFVSAGTALPAQSVFALAPASSLDEWLTTASPTDLPLGCTTVIFYEPTTMKDGSIWVPCVFSDGKTLTKSVIAYLDVYVNSDRTKGYRNDVYVATVGMIVDQAP